MIGIAAAPTKAGFRRAALIGLLVLTFINLFNYLDRYVVSALVESLKQVPELGLTDARAGLLMTGFVLVYMLVSPIFGTLGDRRSRPRLIALGVAIWSVATMLGGLAHSFWSLFLGPRHGGGGGGGLRDHRAGAACRLLPQGAARPRVRGLLRGHPAGLRARLRLGRPDGRALRLARGLLRGRRPGAPARAAGTADSRSPRGLHDEGVVVNPHAPAPGGIQSYLALLRNVPYAVTVLGYAAYTFALGGLAFWMPAFLERVRGVPKAEATVQFGAIVVVTGFLGTFGGGWLGDYFLRHSRQAYLWVSGVTTLLAAPLALLAFRSPDRGTYLAATIGAEIADLRLHRPHQLRDHQCGAHRRPCHGRRLEHLRDPHPRRRSLAAFDWLALRLELALHRRACGSRGLVNCRSGLDGRRLPWRAPGLGGMKTLLVGLARLLLRIFFRRVEVVGAELVPADQPVIFALNHPSALVDPLFILALAGRPVSFLAKEPLFRMPVIGAAIRAAGCLPVYRAQDAADVSKNRGTFEAARQLLAHGQAIAIFPEGTSHETPRCGSSRPASRALRWGRRRR